MKKVVKDNLKAIDKPLFFACLIMIVFGLLNIVTSSSREAATWEVGIYHYFFKHLQWLLAGGLLALIIINYPTKKYNSWVLMAVFVIIALLLYSFFDPTFHRGSARWITVMGFNFQPGEFAKIIVIVFSAIMLEKYHKIFKKNQSEAKGVLTILFVGVLAITALVFFQKDFGNSVIIFSIFFLTFLRSNIAWREKGQFLLFTLIVLMAGVIFLYATKGHVLESHQLRRLDFRQPCSKYEHQGYQICNGFIAINEGGLLGLGIGNSKQKYSYIDEPHTDMVFAIIIEEYGVIFASLIFLTYTLIMFRMILIGNRAKTLRLKYLAHGVMIYMFLQILVNLGGLFGVMPLTGVTLPFLSYGGSFTIAFLIALAIVFRVSIENRLAKIKIKKI